MSELIRLLVVAVAIVILVYVAQVAPIPAPFRWVLWALIFIIVLFALLPFLGVHLPA